MGEPKRVSERGVACFRLVERSDGARELVVTGTLPSDWLARATARLAAGKIGLLHGHVRRVGRHGLWAGHLELDLRYAAQPVEPDRLLGEAPDPPRPRLLDFELRREPGGHALRLDVQAWDAIGLLAGTLATVERLGLAPLELLLETEQECAFHRLRLGRRGGGAPSWRARRALARILSRHVTPG